MVGGAADLPDLAVSFGTVVVDVADDEDDSLAGALVARSATGGRLVVAVGSSRTGWRAAVDALDAAGRGWAVGDLRVDRDGVLLVTLELDAEPATAASRELLQHAAQIAERTGAVIDDLTREIDALTDAAPTVVGANTDAAASSALLIELERTRGDVARAREQLVLAREQVASAREQLVLARERLATSQDALRAERARAATFRASRTGRALAATRRVRGRVRRVTRGVRRRLRRT